MTETVDPKLREDRALLDLIGDKGRCRYLALSAIIKAADASMKSAATFPGSHRRVSPLACAASSATVSSDGGCPSVSRREP